MNTSNTCNCSDCSFSVGDIRAGPSIEMEFELETANKMHFWSSTLLACIFITIGITGNILSIIVWKQKKMQSSTGTYLIGQAIADTGLLVFFFLEDSLPMIFPGVKSSPEFAVFFCYIGFPIFFWFILISIWITVGVTIDRYILVCWIVKAKTLCSHKRAIISMACIGSACFIVNIPHFFTFEPVTPDNETHQAYSETEFGKGFGSGMYEFWVHCMFMVLGPWLVIFVLNIRIIQQVSKTTYQLSTSRTRSGSDKRKKSETQMTHLLLTVTFTFLVLLAFQCITQCFFMLEKGNREIASEAFSIAKLGVVINSSVNFFLYCLSGRKFRHELRIILSCLGPVTLRRQSLSLTPVTSSTGLSTQRNSIISLDRYKENLEFLRSSTENMIKIKERPTTDISSIDICREKNVKMKDSSDNTKSIEGSSVHL